jgi:hypothetical protein
VRTTKVFLAVGGKDDLLALVDAPFEGKPADKACDDASTVKEVSHTSMVKDGTLTDPLMHQQLSAYVKAYRDLNYLPMLANRVALVAKVTSLGSTADLPVDSLSIASLVPSAKSLITKDDVSPYAQEALPEAYCEMFEHRHSHALCTRILSSFILA